MKYFIILGLFAASCSNDKVAISRKEYAMLKGDTLANKYPKEVYFDNNIDAAPSFKIYLGSDGHEYQVHRQGHADNQWIHYIDCELCIKRRSK